MWYRSMVTNKIINDSSRHSVDNIYGDGTFDNLIKIDYLVEIENPSVVDILKENGSTAMAALRYREIHKCTLKEARQGVELILKDMTNLKNKKRGNKRQWKKNSAELADSQSQSDTDKSSAEKPEIEK